MRNAIVDHRQKAFDLSDARRDVCECLDSSVASELYANVKRFVRLHAFVMKLCPYCKRSYHDQSLNFCLEDGTPLRNAQPGSEEKTFILPPETAPTLRPPAPIIAPAVERPETRYAKSGDVSIAYQVLGSGPIDVVYVPGWVSHLEYAWESPLVASFYQRLASFSRLILFDKRGTGLSDQTSDMPTLEQRMDDVRAVMEAADSSRAVVFGMSEGGNMSLLFAATYPERTVALVTFGVFAKREWDADYPWAPTAEKRQGFYDAIEKEWGGPIGIEDIAPSLATDPLARNWWGTYQRRSATPRAALALAHMNTSIDVRNVLSAIRVPTLMLHRTGDLDANIEEGRYIAARIAGAKFVELPGNDHLIYAGDQQSVLDEVESFIENIQRAPSTETVLATVLFTEVVDSDADVERFLSLAQREADWFKGKTSKAGARGFVAAFDGPVRAVRCACALRDAAQRAGMQTRSALHTALCDIDSDQISGAAVEHSAAIASIANSGEVLASTTVRDLVSGSGLEFDDRGVRKLGDYEWRLCSVKNTLSTPN